MGSKYIPSKKDQKANQRYQEKSLLPKSTFKKPSANPPTARVQPAAKKT